MEIFDYQKIRNFKEVMERIFLNGDETKIAGKIKSFMSELKSSEFDEGDILKYLVNHLTAIFLFGEGKTSDGTFHLTRDFAMALFANVFPDKVTGAENPNVKKVDFMMFLAGIFDSPKQSSPLSSYIEKIARTDENILITGKSGTGKELHASVIHYMSSRLNKRFLPINCAAIPESLMESELFGITKDVATDVEANEGIFNAVGGGTLFLDEIGDMPLRLQAEVLRVLQSRKFYKVGDRENECIFKGRVIAATNKDLKEAIKKRPAEFRPDLFYRLNVLPLELPSLEQFSKSNLRKAILNKLLYITCMLSKESINDIRIDFRTREKGIYVAFNRTSGFVLMKDDRFISDDALQLLENYNFPGNYRELDNFLRQAFMLSDNGRIEVSNLPSEVREHKETESPKYRQEGIDIETIFLKDITHYATEIKEDIVRKKLESVYQSGRTITSKLKSEGVTDKKDYHRIRKNIADIIGQKEMSRIIKGKDADRVISA